MQKPNRKAARAALAYSHMGLQLAATVGLGAWGGHWAQERWHCAPWGLVLGASVGVAVGLSVFLLEALRFNREENRSPEGPS